MYDLIGDIHGHADELKELLTGIQSEVSGNTVKNTVKNLGLSRSLTDFEGVAKPKKP